MVKPPPHYVVIHMSMCYLSLESVVFIYLFFGFLVTIYVALNPINKESKGILGTFDPWISPALSTCTLQRFL